VIRTAPSFRAARRTDAVQPSDVLEMMAIARRMQGDGIDVAYLVQGEPDFDTPRHVKDAAYQALLDGYTHYPPPEGYPELRRAIAARMRSELGLVYEPDSEVLVTNGASLGLYLAIASVVDEGDEVLITDPAYGAYAMLIESAGGTVVRVPCSAEGGVSTLDVAALEALVTDRTRAIVYCDPDNPTGRIMPEATLRRIGELAVEHDFIVISDEVYHAFSYDAPALALASLDARFRERCIVVNSFSKTYAMTGWRLGFNMAPPHLMAGMRKMNAIAGRAAAAFVQRAGIAALEGTGEEIATMTSEYRRRRDHMLARLAEIPGLRFTRPDGGFYVFVDVRDYARDTRAFARTLLERGKVVLTPGEYYGPAGAGHLRFSFVAAMDVIDRGLDGVAAVLEGMR
jgi:aspartate/methionine/tyrosine aminotransferase